jgi:hypothetical protein
MTDPSPAHRRKEPPLAPRWVLVLGVMAIVLVVAFLAVHLGGGMPMNHGM